MHNRFTRVRAAKRRKEYSPRRKPWVRSRQNAIAPKGRKKSTRQGAQTDTSFAPLGLRPIRPSTHGLRYGLHS
jgi:hypothetical protein